MTASQNRLYSMLQHSAHRLKVYSDARMLSAAGITTAQAAILAIVSSHGQISQRSLATMLRLREGAISTMADRLLKAGLIERIRLEADSRVRMLTLTPSGTTALAKADNTFEEINQILDEVFPGSQSADLSASLRTLSSKLSDEAGIAGI